MSGQENALVFFELGEKETEREGFAEAVWDTIHDSLPQATLILSNCTASGWQSPTKD
jgi:hypothetical protein